MSTGYWQRNITNDAGDVIPNAQVEVREPSSDFTGPLVSLVDIDGTGLSNPFNADSEGFARFGADPQLVDVRATGSGSQRTWRRVEVLGTAATQSDDRYAHRANNLSDLANAGTSRDNLGLGTAAVADVVGTVSQSGGDPTGAIIERGSISGEGKYIKFADGSAMCWGVGVYTSIDITDTDGNIFICGSDLSIQFPSFILGSAIDTDDMTASVFAVGGNQFVVGRAVDTSNTIRFRAARGSSASGATVRVKWQVAGRWF